MKDSGGKLRIQTSLKMEQNTTREGFRMPFLFKKCLSYSFKTTVKSTFEKILLSELKPAFQNQNPDFKLSTNLLLKKFKVQHFIQRKHLHPSFAKKLTFDKLYIKYIFFRSYKSRGRSLRSPLTTCVLYYGFGSKQVIHNFP